MMQANARRRSPRKQRFERWLRTGFWLPEQLADPALEVKFNPNHDPENGQFTFANGAGNIKSSAPPKGGAKRRSHDPRDPANYTTYKVKPGDTLTSIAATRSGVTPDDLKWLNDKSDDRLQVGDEIKVPNQDFLDEGKDAFDRFNALDKYMQMHDGKLPPDPAQPPTLFEQTYGPGSKVEKANGYTYDIDPEGRTRVTDGDLTDGPAASRSRKNQDTAGGDDRLDTDDGGHFIASRFNGPSDAFNHFAQDSNFNRGAYRILEDRWASDLDAGEQVHVSIYADYLGHSKRPDSLDVDWIVGGQRQHRHFKNSRGGK